MQPRREEQWLIMVLGKRLSLALVPKGDLPSFQIGGAEYRGLESNFLTTFYDRLLDQDDRLSGVRVWPVSDSALELWGRLPKAPYVQRGQGFFDIWLSEAPIPDAEDAGDQAFGGRVYQTESGALALSLDVNYLCASDADFENVQDANATWVDVA
jgi:hypothetical protein